MLVKAQLATAASIVRQTPHCGLCHTEQRLPFSRKRKGCSSQRGSSVCASSAGNGASSSKASETPEQAVQRRVRESQKVEERVIPIFTQEEFKEQLQKAGHNLVVLEVEASEVCQTGQEEAELYWKEDIEASLEPCKKLKHVLQRTARDSPDVVFLTLEADGEEGQEACEAMGIQVLPTLQFWRDQKLLWEHRGVLDFQQNMGEGVLYYGDTLARGEKASTYIRELTSQNEFDHFINDQGDNVLTVVDVSLSDAPGCIRIFPAVLAMAKNFKGYAAFARLLGDTNDETKQLLKKYNIQEVPTFLFFRSGKEQGRHVGSSRADLIGQILMQQSTLGLPSPPVSRAPARPRPKMERRV